MVKEKIRQSTVEDDEAIKKVVNPEGEFEIPIGDGKRKRVFWARTGFSSRAYYRSYFKKRLNEAVSTGLVGIEGHFKGNPEGEVDGKNTIFALNPQSVDEKTLRIYEESTLMKEGDDYNYSPDLRVLFFIKAPTKKLEIEYDYYDPEIYNTIFNDSFIMVLIFLCAREMENHEKRIFSSVEQIGQLTMPEINEIMTLYSETRPFGDLKPNEEKLKNQFTPLRSSEEGVSQKDMDLIPGVEKSGEEKQ